LFSKVQIFSELNKTTDHANYFYIYTGVTLLNGSFIAKDALSLRHKNKLVNQDN